MNPAWFSVDFLAAAPLPDPTHLHHWCVVAATSATLGCSWWLGPSLVPNSIILAAGLSTGADPPNYLCKSTAASGCMEHVRMHIPLVFFKLVEFLNTYMLVCSINYIKINGNCGERFYCRLHSASLLCIRPRRWPPPSQSKSPSPIY